GRDLDHEARQHARPDILVIGPGLLLDFWAQGKALDFGNLHEVLLQMVRYFAVCSRGVLVPQSHSGGGCTQDNHMPQRPSQWPLQPIGSARTGQPARYSIKVLSGRIPIALSSYKEPFATKSAMMTRIAPSPVDARIRVSRQ